MILNCSGMPAVQSGETIKILGVSQEIWASEAILPIDLHGLLEWSIFSTFVL